MSDTEETPPSMLWPTSVKEDAFVDLSSRSPSRDGLRTDSSPPSSPRDHHKSKEKEKNNKTSDNDKEKEREKEHHHHHHHHHSESDKSEMTAMKEMKERIKMKTGVFRKHLTEYIKEMSSSSSQAAAAPVFDLEDNNKCIVWDDKGRLKHATLVKIVEKLTSEKHTDTAQIFVFLQTYRTFITPKKLLEFLIARFNSLVPNKDMTAEELEVYDRTIRKPTRLRVLVMFKYWIEQYFLDWDENPELDQPFRDFMKTDVLPYGLTNLSEQVLRILDKRIQEKQRTETPVNKFENITKFDITVFDFWGFSAKEIAAQLTLHEFSLFKAIKPYEFLGLAWTKKDGRKRAPNILAAIGAFNKMVEWLRTEILMEDTLKDRVARLSKILEIANEFYRINNFNGLVEIIATLESGPIARLKKTWAALPLEQMEACDNLKKIVSQEKNFMKYREKLHKIEPPCVPYLGVYLTDLVFIDEGNSDSYGEMVNFFKCGMISAVIREIQQYQQTKYSVTHVPMFQRYVEECNGFSEKASYDISMELEPRTANAAEEEFGDVGQTPQQYVMYGRMKNKVLNYSDDPFDVQLLLLGTFAPITVRLPPKCNAQQALEIFENNMHGVTASYALVVHPRAQILDQFAFLSDYATKKDIIVIQIDPQLVRVGISQSKTMQQIKDMVLDFASPLFCMIPLIQMTFNLKEEIAFLYVEGYNVARWLNIHKTIAEQACNPSVGFILIYPLTNIVQKEPPKLDSMDKSGYLSIRQLNSKGFKLNMPKKRFVILQDHFLVFCKPNQELTPYKAICLEHFKTKLGNDQTITLTRSFKGFLTTIIKSMTIVLCAQPGEDIADWFAIMQRNCGIIGDQTVFGIELAAAAAKRGKNVAQIPLVVEKSLLYLFSGEKKWDNLFNAPANPIFLEHYKRLFDQGVDVEFSGSITDPYTVAQLLLSYLDELPVPLLTYDLYDAFVANGSKSFENEADLIAELHNILAKLPVVNKSVLCLLLVYLHESGGDKLGLSIALGPVLLKSVNPSKTNDESKACSLVVMRLIAHQEKLFSGAKEGAIARKILIKNLTNRPKKGEDESVILSSPPTQRAPRKISSLIIPERMSTGDLSPVSDPNLTKTVLNRYLDLDVSVNKDSPPLTAQHRQRSDSSSSSASSFMRTTPSRARGDSFDGIKLGSSVNLSTSPSSSSSNLSFSGHNTFSPNSPQIGNRNSVPNSPPMSRNSVGTSPNIPHRSSPIPTPAKRTTSENNVQDIKRHKESSSLPDYLERRGVSARDLHTSNSPPTLNPLPPIHISAPLHTSISPIIPPLNASASSFTSSSGSYSPPLNTSTSSPPLNASTSFALTLPPLQISNPLVPPLSVSTPPAAPPLPPSPSSTRMQTIGKHLSKFMGTINRSSRNLAPSASSIFANENEKIDKPEADKGLEKSSSVDRIVDRIAENFGRGMSLEKIDKSIITEKSDKSEDADKSAKADSRKDDGKEHKHERSGKHKRSNKRSKDNKPKEKRDKDKDKEKDKERKEKHKERKDRKSEKHPDTKRDSKEAGKIHGEENNEVDAESEKATTDASDLGTSKDKVAVPKREKRKSKMHAPPSHPLPPTPTPSPTPYQGTHLIPPIPTHTLPPTPTPSPTPPPLALSGPIELAQIEPLSLESIAAHTPLPSTPPSQSPLTQPPSQSPRAIQSPRDEQKLSSNSTPSQSPRTSQPQSLSPSPSQLLTKSGPVKDSIKMRISQLERVSAAPDYSALESPILKKLNTNNFCSQCGEKFVREAKFCSSCGHPR